MKLRDNALLAKLTIKVLTGECQDRAATREVLENHGAADDAGKFRKCLFAPDALRTVKQVAGEARNRHYALTLPWNDEGYRILPSNGFMRYRDELVAYKRRFEAAVEEFLAHYEGHVQDARNRLGSLFRASDYPARHEVERRFEFSVSYVPVPDADDFRVHLSDADRAVMREQLESQAKDAVARSVRHVAERIRAAVGHMAERLRAYQPGTNDGERTKGVFRDTLVENIRELVDILPSLNLTNDAAIADIISSMKEQLTQYSAEQLRKDESARNQVAASAEDILRRMEGYGL